MANLEQSLFIEDLCSGNLFKGENEDCFHLPVYFLQNVTDYDEDDIQASQMDKWTENGKNKHDKQLASEPNQWIEAGRHLYGHHETQESEGGEADLHKHKNECKKNPGHLNFIPVDTFSLRHLPEGLQDNDLYEFIKVVADLTVRVDVKTTSPCRPEFSPRTNIPYPFFNRRGEVTLRTGTGMVRRVKKFIDGKSNDVRGGKHLVNTKCWCTECNISDHPSSLWWEFNVHTATHVVFNDFEASHTSLRLFYDRDDNSVDIHNKVSDCEICNRDIEYDRCVLRCVTCDKNIGDKLYTSWRHYFDVCKKVNKKYESSRDNHRMTFIVSHPHGCSKHVSVGQWKDMYQVDTCFTKCTYTTCTCPGSSGAFVNCVGFDEGWVFHEPFHSGSKSGLNYSGVAQVN